MLGILVIRLVSLAVLDLLWVGQHDNKVIFQDVEHGNPVRARALHHYVRDAFRSKPISQTNQVQHGSIKSPSVTSRFFVSRACQYTAKKKSLAYIDSRTSFVDFAQTFLLVPEIWP